MHSLCSWLTINAQYACVQALDINGVEAGKGALGPQSLKLIVETFHVGVEWIQYGDERKKDYSVDGKDDRIYLTKQK